MDTTASRGVNRWTRVVTIAAGIVFVGDGLWAMAAPESFFDVLGQCPPYNQHFVQDVGAFQIGLGAVLLIAALTLSLGTRRRRRTHTRRPRAWSRRSSFPR